MLEEGQTLPPAACLFLWGGPYSVRNRYSNVHVGKKQEEGAFSFHERMIDDDREGG